MEHEAIFEGFIGDAIITDVLSLLKSGKEAVVYRCAAHPKTGVQEVAVKIYKDVEKRSFKGAKEYLDGRIGRTILKRRDILHVMSDPRAMQSTWIYAEWEAIGILHKAGIPVPKPLAQSGAGPAIAMEFVPGDSGLGYEAAPAPRLRDYHPAPAEADTLQAELISALERMLGHDIVHGEFSAYNVLVRDGHAVVIDFPQWADARHSSRAKDMFFRDVRNTLDFFAGKTTAPALDPVAVAADIWERWDSGDLYRDRDAARLAAEWGLAALNF